MQPPVRPSRVAVGILLGSHDEQVEIGEPCGILFYEFRRGQRDIN